MATTDRQEIHNAPCTCGHGKYLVFECMPDHPYARARQMSWESKIECDECITKFSLSRWANHIIRTEKGVYSDNMHREVNLSLDDVLEVICKAVYPFGPEDFVPPAALSIIEQRKNLSKKLSH